MEDYTTLNEYGTYTYEEKKSVFIGECVPIKSEDEALSFINNIKKTIKCLMPYTPPAF